MQGKADIEWLKSTAHFVSTESIISAGDGQFHMNANFLHTVRDH